MRQETMDRLLAGEAQLGVDTFAVIARDGKKWHMNDGYFDNPYGTGGNHELGGPRFDHRLDEAQQNATRRNVALHSGHPKR